LLLSSLALHVLTSSMCLHSCDKLPFHSFGDSIRRWERKERRSLLGSWRFMSGRCMFGIGKTRKVFRSRNT
jgi:hypothetical protein